MAEISKMNRWQRLLVMSLADRRMRCLTSTNLTIVVLLGWLVGTATAQSQEKIPSLAPRPLVIAHRGASGYRPEHTLEGYKLAIAQGADFIEPDLVITKDGVLVARHENYINDTTNVADHPEFASRKTTKTIDGKTLTGWFVEDFTLAEIKTLRARGRNRESRAFNDKFQLVTFQEMIDLARETKRDTGRTIGLYPETKHPSYFRSIGMPLEPPLLAILKANGFQGRQAPIIIQSFEVANLKVLSKETEIRLMQLIDDVGAPQDFIESHDPRTFADLVTPEGLREIAGYAQVLGVNKSLIFPRADASVNGASPVDLVQEAHRDNLLVHCWTFRAENQYLPARFRRGSDPETNGDLTGEVRMYFNHGVDGVFTNHPDLAVAALSQRR